MGISVRKIDDYTALISTIHIWLNALDSGNEIATVFFDFKKAFDTVPHSLLIDKLRKLQLHPCVIEWISNKTISECGNQWKYIPTHDYQEWCTTRFGAWATAFLNLHQQYL